ncbi:MAG: apolipoprotein N-acyltransferase [Actinomycetota bacterium]|nr:apolipoprotein N-acyltransferase [Actinomycetota bacterium]
MTLLPAAPPVAVPPVISDAAPADPRRSRGRRLLSFALAAAVAVLSGLLLSAAFPPVAWPVLAVPAVAGLTWVCHGRRPVAAAGLGFAAGMAFFLSLMDWLQFLGPDALVAVAALQALFFAATGAALSLLTRLPAWPLWTACWWVAIELARGRVPWGGLPWGRLAFSQVGTPLQNYAAVGGLALITFAVALVAGLMLWALLEGVRAGRRTRAALAVAVTAAMVGVGALIPVPTGGESAGGPASATVALVQGNVPRLGLDAFAQRRAVLDNHADATTRLADDITAGRQPRPDVVIWPENASDLDPYAEPEARRVIDQAVRAVGTPVLVGAVVGAGPRLVENSGIVWDPASGPGERYIKRHLVPFGEYLPMRDLLTRFIERFEMIPRDFRAGTKPGVLQLGPVTIGDVMCFEVAFDAAVRDAVTGGGRVIVVQTNNASYGDSAQTYQQLAMGRLRAIEHGRTVLVAATSGVSAVITPDGGVVRQSDIFTAETLVERVALRDSLTLADRLGPAPEWLLTATALLALAAALRRRSRPAGVAQRATAGPAARSIAPIRR